MRQLYAVTSAGGRARTPAGLERYDDGRLAVLHRAVTARPEPAAELVLDYGAVLRRLADQETVLPMRYGTTVADTSEIGQLLDEHGEEWERLLHRLAGHSELIVHLPAVAPPEPADSSGREYLMARASTVHDTDRRREELAGLDGVREARALPGREDRRISLLVADPVVGPVGERIARWAAGHGWTARVTGPWPPFSFCLLEEP